MLAADVCEGALEQLGELLVGRLERRICQVDLGQEVGIPAPARERLCTPTPNERGPG